MPRTNKEKNQMIMLAVFSVAVLSVIGYLLRDKFLPSPEGKVDVPPIGERLTIPELGDFEKLFDREDFVTLESFGNVPVTVADYEPASNPFRDTTGVGGFSSQ